MNKADMDQFLMSVRVETALAYAQHFQGLACYAQQLMPRVIADVEGALYSLPSAFTPPTEEREAEERRRGYL